MTVAIKVCKASAHGLGFLYSPLEDFDAAAKVPGWVIQAWEWILNTEAGIPCDLPSWFPLPAMMRFTITTTQVLKVLQTRQRDLPYSQRAKPFNFVSSPLIDRLNGHPVGIDQKKFMLIGPYSSKPSEWFDLQYVNIHDGRSYRLGKPGKRMPYEAEANSYGDVVDRYRWHRESKSLAPDGSGSTHQTHGLLQRNPVHAYYPRYISKESNSRWEQGEDISILDTFTLEYRPNETEHLTIDRDLQSRVSEWPIRPLASMAGVSTRTVKAAREGKRLRQSTIEKLEKALRSGISPKKTRTRSAEIRFTLDDPE